MIRTMPVEEPAGAFLYMLHQRKQPSRSS